MYLYSSYCTISLNLFIYFLFIVKCTWNDIVSFTVCFINIFIIILLLLLLLLLLLYHIHYIR